MFFFVFFWSTLTHVEQDRADPAEDLGAERQPVVTRTRPAHECGRVPEDGIGVIGALGA